MLLICVHCVLMCADVLYVCSGYVLHTSGDLCMCADAVPCVQVLCCTCACVLSVLDGV
jgi:hypothetical protein